MSKPRLVTAILLIILVLGAFLRLFRLGEVPAGLHFDEAQAGYNSFLLANFGKNITGQSWPIDINSFGDYRPAMISYLTAGFVKFLGLSIFTTRMPTALVGILTVFLVFIFARLCFHNRSVALLAALLTAFSPMTIVFDRATTEAVIELAFMLSAVILLILALKREKSWLLIPVYIFITAAYFTYQISRVLSVPMLIATIIACYLQFRPPKKLIFLALVPLFVYLIFPFFFYLRTPFGQGRFRQVSVFTFPEVQNTLDEQIREDGNTASSLVTRFFHNKLVNYTMDIAQRYTIFFSPDVTLFSLPQPDRYAIPETGAITLIEFGGLLFFLGAVVYRKNSRPLALLPVFFLLLAPLPSAATFEAAPNFLRAIFMTPYLQLVAAAGLITFLATLGKRWRFLASILVVIIFTWQSLYFLHQYLVHEPAHYDAIKSRNTEMESLALFLYQDVPTNGPVLLPEYNGPYIYYLFFNQLNIFAQHYTQGSRGFGGNFEINNLYFFDGQCISSDRLFDRDYSLIILKSYCHYPSWTTPIKIFYLSDGSASYIAYRPDMVQYKNYETLYQAAKTELEREQFLKQVDATFVVPPAAAAGRGPTQ